jgi:hypothetical protein
LWTARSAHLPAEGSAGRQPNATARLPLQAEWAPWYMCKRAGTGGGWAPGCIPLVFVIGAAFRVPPPPPDLNFMPPRLRKPCTSYRHPKIHQTTTGRLITSVLIHSSLISCIRQRLRIQSKWLLGSGVSQRFGWRNGNVALPPFRPSAPQQEPCRHAIGTVASQPESPESRPAVKPNLPQHRSI